MHRCTAGALICTAGIDIAAAGAGLSAIRSRLQVIGAAGERWPSKSGLMAGRACPEFAQASENSSNRAQTFFRAGRSCLRSP
jgi:hypothetical protein